MASQNSQPKSRAERPLDLSALEGILILDPEEQEAEAHEREMKILRQGVERRRKARAAKEPAIE